jgi:hypothetical protein
MAWHWQALIFYATGWLVVGGLFAVAVQEGTDWRGRPLSKTVAKLSAFLVGGAVWPWLIWRWVRGA